MTWIFLGAAALLVVWMALMAWLYMRQSGRIFKPDREILKDPEDAGPGWMRVPLNAPDGVALDAWFKPAEEQNEDRAILFLHGNSGNLSTRLETLRLYASTGLAVLAIDYRGYGRSDGRPSENGIYSDALAAWQWLTGPAGFSPSRILVIGRSLGGPVAAWLAARTNPGALSLESTFSSMPELAQKLYPLLPARILCRFHLDTRGHLARTGCPVLVVHSPEDELIPIVHARRLLETAGSRGRFHGVTGPHAAVSTGAPGHYLRGVGRFVDDVLPAVMRVDGAGTSG